MPVTKTGTEIDIESDIEIRIENGIMIEKYAVKGPRDQNQDWEWYIMD